MYQSQESGAEVLEKIFMEKHTKSYIINIKINPYKRICFYDCFNWNEAGLLELEYH